MRIAIYQSAGGGLSLDQRLENLSNQVVTHQQAISNQIDLVICPELFVSGYNTGDQLREHAQPADGDIYHRVAEIAQSSNTAILYGYPESASGKLWNAAGFVSSQGDLIANHRKQLNSPGSFEEDYFTPGNCTTQIEYNGLQIAILICYEVEFPEAVRNAAINGAHLVAVPTALVSQWDVVASRVVPARAFENGVWLAYANHAGHENGFDYLGGSKIVAPDGVIEADAGSEEGMISVEVDIPRVNAAQKRLPYLRDFVAYQFEAE